MLASVIAVSAARGLAANAMPAGTAIAMAMASADGRQLDMPQQRREEPVRMRDDELPGFEEQHVVQVARQRVPIGSQAASQPSSRARLRSVATARAHAVSAPAQIFGAMIVADAVEDERAETACVHISGDHRDADDGDRRRCAGRRRSPARPAAARRASGSPARSCPCPRAASTTSGGTSRMPGGDIADQDHQRERDHADDRVGAAQADDGNEQREERERRDRVQESR